MQKYFLATLMSLALLSCHSDDGKHAPIHAAESLDSLFADYWEERMQLFPLEATASGDNRYNDQLTITIAGSFRDSLDRFYRKYAKRLEAIDTSGIDAGRRMSYGLLRYEMEMSLEGLKYPTHYMPINQFWSLTLDLPQLGSGQGNQPFKTVKDYDNWLKRISVLPAWTDTAIANMRLGMEKGWVLPRSLVVKILPQLKAMLVYPESSIFYKPVTLMPDSFGEQKKRLSHEFGEAIGRVIEPSYRKLYDFLREEYLPRARSISGISELPGGREYYDYCIRYWTTTRLTPDSIYQLGLQEVERISREMNLVKDKTGFKGDLKSFFHFLEADRQFYPFRTAEQVLDSFRHIRDQEEPLLGTMFSRRPKTPFEIRQTEAFRAASASAEYNPGSEDGRRPGIFYVPVLDAAKFNAVGMNTLFLHEAIPGHHYQISLTQENQSLPKFRRFLWYGAYGEGWALYCETLGGQLGLYDNLYQYFGHLSDAMHRAIRLVVDIGLHSKGMTREKAIAYMMAHERTSEAEATAEIERYMAIPGQALSYKIGQLTISAARAKYEQQMGSSFNIASFHDEVLKDGCVPLEVLQSKLEKWSGKTP